MGCEGLAPSCSLSAAGRASGRACGKMGCVLSAYLRMLHTQLLLGLLQEAGGEDWCGVDFQRRVFVEVIREEHAVRFPPSKEYTLRFLRAFLDAIARNSSGEVDDDMIEWYTSELQAQPRPEHEGGPPAKPHCKTYYTTLGCVTMRTKTGFGGYETVGGTGNTLWEAAFYMCDFVLSSGDLFSGKRIVELGAGCGMSGVLLSRLPKPPSQITLTDHTVQILKAIELNMVYNGVPLASRHLQAYEAVHPKPCPSVPTGCAVAAAMLDWETFSEEDASRLGPVDYVLGADIVFDPVLVPPLTSVIEKFLRKGAICCYLAATVRNQDTLALLETEVRSRGLTLQRVPRRLHEKVDNCFSHEIDGAGEIRMLRIFV